MIDFEKRLKSLKDRRQGSRERVIYDSTLSYSQESAAINEGFDYRQKEDYENLRDASGVKYAIGAMSVVNSQSTNVSIKEGERVADNLINSLYSQNIFIEKRLQGSVALDIHIKGYSDVDMLVLIKNPVNIENPKVDPSRYSPSTDPRPLLEIVKELRGASEVSLTNSFPKATVDVSGNKSIALEGGSLQRKIDIVPACWYDTRNYQQTNYEHDRGVKIYNKGDHELLMNYPFTHIKLVNDKDAVYSGNLKSVARLLKNMIADMPDYKKTIVKKLSSYDIAAIAFHMNNRLLLPTYMRLGLVEKTRAYLRHLLDDIVYRNLLYVPDNSRKIFNDESKVRALEILSKECSDLAESIFKELKPFVGNYDSSVILNREVEML